MPSRELRGPGGKQAGTGSAPAGATWERQPLHRVPAPNCTLSGPKCHGLCTELSLWHLACLHSRPSEGGGLGSGWRRSWRWRARVPQGLVGLVVREVHCVAFSRSSAGTASSVLVDKTLILPRPHRRGHCQNGLRG